MKTSAVRSLVVSSLMLAVCLGAHAKSSIDHATCYIILQWDDHRWPRALVQGLGERGYTTVEVRGEQAVQELLNSGVTNLVGYIGFGQPDNSGYCKVTTKITLPGVGSEQQILFSKSAKGCGDFPTYDKIVNAMPQCVRP